MFAHKHQKLWIGLLAALWLVAQLASAFHLGHTDTELAAAQEHSCVLCKVAQIDDVVLASPAAWAVTLAALFFLLPVAPSFNSRIFLGAQARAPPAI